MIVDHDPRREGPTYVGRDHVRARSSLHRFLGGSPVAVVVKLLFLSILAGAAMAMIGLTPGRLFWHAYETMRALVDLGLETVQDFGAWIIAGAVVVVPLWLIARLLAVAK